MCYAASSPGVVHSSPPVRRPGASPARLRHILPASLPTDAQALTMTRSWLIQREKKRGRPAPAALLPLRACATVGVVRTAYSRYKIARTHRRETLVATFLTRDGRDPNTACHLGTASWMRRTVSRCCFDGASTRRAGLFSNSGYPHPSVRPASR